MASSEVLATLKSFLLGAFLGGAVTFATIYVSGRHIAWSSEKSSSHTAAPNGKQAQGLSIALQDEILSEQFTRNIQFFGRTGQEIVLGAFVVVVGLGGVGSHAAHMLLRAGVGKLRIIDFDQVSLSSLNRHAVATRSDVGLPKARVLKSHFQQIVPEAIVEAEVAMFSADAEEHLLSGQPDYVLDAIDDIETKIALLAACKRRGLPVISACGAGAKADPSRVRVLDLSEASLDPLARKVRHQLRVRHRIRSGIAMVLSSERPRCSLIPIEQLSHAPHELQVIPNFRIRTIPVLGTTPAIFGMAAASWILCHLAGRPYIPEPMFLVKNSELEVLLHRLKEREELAFDNPNSVDLDIEDIVYLARDVWRARSAFSDPSEASGEKGLTRNVSDLHFTRWDAAQEASPYNLILASAQEADKHDVEGVQAVKDSNFALYQRIESILAAVKVAFGFCNM